MNDSEVRVEIYREFVRSGRAPLAAALAKTMGVPVEEMREAFERLGSGRAVALQPESREVVFASPFSAVPTPFVVHAGGRSYFSPCVWDAFGAVGMMGVDAEIETSCPCCGEAMRVPVRDRQVAPTVGVVHFALPAKQWWANIVFT